MLNGLCRLTRQTTLLGGTFPFQNTFLGLGIQLLCHGGRATLLADAQHRDRPADRALTHHDCIANLDFAGRLGKLFVDLDASFNDLV